MTKKISEDVKKLLGVEKSLVETCDEFTVIGASKQGGLVSISKTNGDKPVDQIRNYEKLLMSGMVNIIGEPNKNGKETRMKITQGKLDLAMLMALDIVQMLINLGAEDYAGIEEEVCDEDESSWVEEADVDEAYIDNVDVFEDEKDSEGETILVAPKNADELAEVFGKVFGVSPETCKKVLETEGKSKKEVKCFAKKLSKDEWKELKKVLDKLEGED